MIEDDLNWVVRYRRVLPDGGATVIGRGATAAASMTVPNGAKAAAVRGWATILRASALNGRVRAARAPDGG